MSAVETKGVAAVEPARIALALEAAAEIDQLMMVQVRMLHRQEPESDLALRSIAVRCIDLLRIVQAVDGGQYGDSVDEMRSVLFGHVVAGEIGAEGGVA